MEKHKVTLREEERDELLSITKGGTYTSKKVIHALILLNCDEGELSEKVNNEDVSRVLKIGMRTIDRVKKKFVEEGHEAALENRPTSVLISQCLNRRIDNLETMKKEAAAWQNHRNNKEAKIKWQFTRDDARIKLLKLYPSINV